MQSLIFSTIPIFDEKPYLKEIYSTIIKIDEDAVLIDQSIFYPVGGGQLGDTGTITVENNIYKVVDTFKDNNLGIWLKLDSAISPDLVGKKIHTKIDWDRRYKLMQMHTCMHLLCSIINAPVTGCSIREDKARLDFDLPESKFDKEYITNTLNELISKNLDVRAFNVTTEQLQSIPSAIKTVNVAPPEQNNSIRVIEVQEADMQPCGGTHVKNTSEISSITCSKIKKVSRLNRRIEITWQ